MNPVVCRQNLLIILLLLATFTAVFAQNIVLKQPVELKNGQEAFPIVNEQTQKICLVLLDNKSVNAYLLNGELQVEKHLVFENLQFMNLLNAPEGSFYNGDSYVVVAKMVRTESAYIFLEIDFEKEKITFNERRKFSLPEGDELLSTFSEAGDFFVLSAVREVPALRLCRFNALGVPDISVFDVPKGVVLSTADKNTKDLHRYLSNQKMSRTIRFTKLPDNASAASILSSVKRHKAYFRNDSLLLTLDNVGAATHLLTLDLKAKSFNYRKIDYPKLQCSSVDGIKPEIQGNSFLYQNYLFQIQSCPSGARIGIRNFSEDTFFQEYQITGRDTAIAFRNSPILLKMERNNKDAKEKVLTTPKDLLSRIDEYNVTISAWEHQSGQLEMMVGAHMLYIPSGGGGPTFMPGMPGISTPYGNVPGTAGRWVSNPTFGSFNTSGLDRTVSFKSLISPAGEHITGEATPNAYDKLQEVIEKQFDDKEFKAETVFYFKSAFYFGTYNKDDKQYYIYRYSN